MVDTLNWKGLAISFGIVNGVLLFVERVACLGEREFSLVECADLWDARRVSILS